MIIFTSDAARILGLSETRVRVLIRAGRLPAARMGRLWVLDPRVVRAFRRKPRRPGRPRKSKR